MVDVDWIWFCLKNAVKSETLWVPLAIFYVRHRLRPARGWLDWGSTWTSTWIATMRRHFGLLVFFYFFQSPPAFLKGPVWISNLFQKFLLGFWLIVDIYAGIRYWHSRAYLKPFELTGTTWNGPQRSQNGSKKLLCQLPQFFRSSIRWPWSPWVWKKVWIWILTTRFFCQTRTPRVNLVDFDFWVHGSIKAVERWLC